MRLSFVRGARPVYLGGRSFGAGPLRVRWGGRWYVAQPITLGGLLQLGGILGEMGGSAALQAGLCALPAALQRVLVPVLLAEWVPGRDDRHLARATPSQLGEFMAAWHSVNDWPLILHAVSPREQAEGSLDESAFDRSLAALGERFGCWPHDLLGKPYVEVQAVIDALAYQAGEGAPLSDQTADKIRAMSAAREAARA